MSIELYSNIMMNTIRHTKIETNQFVADVSKMGQQEIKELPRISGIKMLHDQELTFE